jgi:hypothetical protein
MAMKHQQKKVEILYVLYEKHVYRLHTQTSSDNSGLDKLVCYGRLFQVHQIISTGIPKQPIIILEKLKSLIM